MSQNLQSICRSVNKIVHEYYTNKIQAGHHNTKKGKWTIRRYLISNSLERVCFTPELIKPRVCIENL